jgi:hypothetical protein
MAEYSLLNLVIFLIIALSLGEFAMQIVISDLACWIKGKIAFTLPYDKRLNTISRFSFWRKLLGNWFWMLSPLSFLIIIGINIHKFIANLFGCPWCICWWLMLTVNYFYLKLDIITALILAPIGLVMVTILDRLHTK